jgi:hypothetical protein
VVFRLLLLVPRVSMSTANILSPQAPPWPAVGLLYFLFNLLLLHCMNMIISLKATTVPPYATKALVGGYRSYLLTSELDGGSWSGSRPGRALPPWKGPPVPVVQETGWASEPVWTEVRGKSFHLSSPVRSQTLY